MKTRIEALAKKCKDSGKKYIFASIDYSKANGGQLILDSDLTPRELGLIINALCQKDAQSIIALGTVVGQLMTSLKNEQKRPVKNSNE